MEATILDALAAGGPIAILAGIIFTMYVRYRNSTEKQMCTDRDATAKQLREDRIFMEDRLTKIIEADQESREAFTKVNAELVVLLREMNNKVKV